AQVQEGRTEGALGLPPLLGRAGLRRGLRRRARLRDRFERPALVRGVALHGLDEVRDQVPAPLQLHVDVRPGLAHPLTERDEAVVGRDEEERDERDDDEDDPDLHWAPLPVGLRYSQMMTG